MAGLVELLPRVLSGEASAWHELWKRSEPLIWGISGKWQVSGPLCRESDERREIVLRVMERLREADFRRLRVFAASRGADSDAAFRSWLLTLAARVAIDRMRAHPENVDPRGRRDEDRWARLVSLDDAPPLAAEIDLHGRTTALELLERARSELNVEQLTALCLWLDGVGFDAIAARLRLDDDRAALKVVRAALKRLRDRYREAPMDERQDAEEAT
jgi:DNA-directed RNA polymerase specialized sigma24 family protein